MKDPAFLFYPNDYIGGTMGMTFEQKGAYIELLMLQFNRGHMTTDMIGQTLGQTMDKIWPVLASKFEQDEQGRYYNQRLESEILKRKAYSQSRRNNLTGKNQHNKSTQNDTTPSGHMTTHMEGQTTTHMENENEDINVIENKEEKEGAGRKGNKQPKPEKTKYTDFVNMTEIEHEKLIEQYGPDATARMITILDNYKGSKGKTYKDDYRAILSWVVDRYNEEQTRNTSSNGKPAAATSGHYSNSQGYQGGGIATPRNETERRTAERRDLKELSLAVLASDQPAEHHGGHQQQ